MRKTIHWNCNCRLRNSAETCPSSCCHGSSLNQTASVNIHTWKNKSCYCVTISQYGYTCKQTTTYHNDTPGALPSWPWQLLLSANQWLIEVDGFGVWRFMLLCVENVFNSLNASWCNDSQHSCCVQSCHVPTQMPPTLTFMLFPTGSPPYWRLDEITLYDGGFKQVAWGKGQCCLCVAWYKNSIYYTQSSNTDIKGWFPV